MLSTCSGFKNPLFRLRLKALSKRRQPKNNEGCDYIRKDINQQIRDTLETMAVGSAGDALKLLMHGNELTDRQLKRLKLENVVAIKKASGSVSEIKFCDRLKAIQCLMAMEKSGDNGSSFLNALLRSGDGEDADE